MLFRKPDQAARIIFLSNKTQCAICCLETFTLSYSANLPKPTASLSLSISRLWLFVHSKTQLDIIAKEFLLFQ